MKYINLAVFILVLGLEMGSHADAHAFLNNSTPLVGSIVTTAPKELRIQFTQAVEPAFSHIQLFSTSGAVVEVGKASLNADDPTQLTAPITGTIAPGRYEVRWDVVSVDTHHTNGHFPFTYQP